MGRVYQHTTVDRINDQNQMAGPGKNLLLWLCEHSERSWTHHELKKKLQMDLEPKQILQKLWDLFDADLIGKGTSDISFQGLKDGTLLNFTEPLGDYGLLCYVLPMNLFFKKERNFTKFD